MKQILLFFSIALLSLFIAIWILSYNKVYEKVDLEVHRFDKELFSITEENVQDKMLSWEADYGTFPAVFASQIMRSMQLNNKQYEKELLAFTYQKDMREAYDSTILLYEDFSSIQHDLELAFGQFSTSFPSFPIPEITTFFGGFNYGVVTYDNNIAIGLENFLGINSKFYKYLSDPKYLRFQKQKKFIVSNVMEVWFNEHFHKFLGGRDLLSQIIYKGKAMYFIDKMILDMPIEDKFRFNNSQMEWVIDNESSIWEFLVYEDLLFSKKEDEFRTFVNYAPFAKGMPNEAPGRVAYYIGYRMVCEYMKNNKINIEDLMYLTDSRQFLQQSKYKPVK
tara:strand:+ start:16328 stop:17332 length:1005 start_codon:yes stop_codon:yes gene_type:complete